MLIHPTMSMAVAEARRDDLMREVRQHPTGGRGERIRRSDPQSGPSGAGLNRRLAHALRRLHRTRAAEPAA